MTITEKYKQVYSDWKYLFEEIGTAGDMTGTYQDSDDLAAMLANPNRKTAIECLTHQIEYWFGNGMEEDIRQDRIYDAFFDLRVRKIAYYYDCEMKVDGYAWRRVQERIEKHLREKNIDKYEIEIIPEVY